MASRILTLVSAGDYRLMRRVNRWRPPRWFQRSSPEELPLAR